MNLIGVYVIAEAGCNHGGDMAVAEKMIEIAASAGADCVKFQVYEPNQLHNPDPEVLNHCRMSRLYPGDVISLMEVCKKNKIDFLASAFDVDSLLMLHDCGCKAVKVPSGVSNSYAINLSAWTCFEKLFVSNGMMNSKAVQGLQRFYNGLGGKKNITFMHCTSAYPCPPEDANMLGMKDLPLYGFDSTHRGFSDHTMTNEAAVMAVALNATTIEHHFCLDETPEDYPDMPVSFQPYRLMDYIRSIRDATVLLGTGGKIIQESEKIMLKRLVPNTYAPTKESKEPDNGKLDTELPRNVPESPEVSGDIRDKRSDCVQ